MFRTLMAATILVGALFLHTSSASAADEPTPKDALSIMYAVQMAPLVCQWKDAKDGSALDAKIVEAEKALGVTDGEKTKLKADAEADLRKDLEQNCDPEGLVRALYDNPN